MMRSAKANTTSIECSVNSTEIAALHHQPLDQRDQLVALARRHAGGRLIHQQQARLVGERDGKLDALDVAIGELAARPVGGVAHADLLEQLERAIAMQLAPPAARADRSRAACEISAICTFSMTVIEPNVAAT